MKSKEVIFKRPGPEFCYIDSDNSYNMVFIWKWYEGPHLVNYDWPIKSDECVLFNDWK